MRHMLTVLGVIIAAIVVGAVLYVYGPKELQQPAMPAPAEAGTPGHDSPVNVSFRVLGEGANATGMPARKTYVIYDQAEFARIWKLGMGPGATVPSVDFSKDYVIAAFAGDKPSGGYGIRIDSLTDEGAKRTVSIALTKPASGCVVTQALTSPFQIVAAPLSDREHVRKDEETETACQ